MLTNKVESFIIKRKPKVTVVPQQKGPIDWTGIDPELKARYDRNQKRLSEEKD